MRDLPLVTIDQSECINCKMCNRVCPRGLFKYEENGAVSVATKEKCMRCYQCVAVCPTNAITGNADDEAIEYNKETFKVEPTNLLNAMKFRRTMRYYKPDPIKEEDMNMILETAKYAPKGKNRELFRYMLFETPEKLEELRLKMLTALKNFAENNDESNPLIANTPTRNRMRILYDLYQETGRDGVLFNAPCCILLISDKRQGGRYLYDSGIAAAYIETMAYSLGLGMCYLGFAVSAVDSDDELKEYLGLKEYECVSAAISLGYPDHKYLRTAPRDDLKLTRI